MDKVLLAAVVTAVAGAVPAVPAVIRLGWGVDSATGAAAVTSVTLSNAFVSANFDLLRGALDSLQGRVEGDGDFTQSPNVAVGQRGAATPAGVAVGGLSVVVTGNGQPLAYQETGTSWWTRPSPLAYTVLANTSSLVSVRIAGLTDSTFGVPSPPAPRITSTITLSLASGDRWLGVNVSTTALMAFNASIIRVSTGWTPVSSVARYATGQRQGMQMEQPYLASLVPWTRWYGVGVGGAVEVRPLSTVTAQVPTVMFAGTWAGRGSGWDMVLAGVPPLLGWVDGFEGSAAIYFTPATAFPTLSFALSPNNYDFPALGLPPAASATHPDDLRSILTPVYASTMGAMHSYDFYPEGRIAPCINVRGAVCYSPMYNFFDPDSFLSIAAMMWSFDTDAWAEAAKLLETNALYFCDPPHTPATCSYGQMIHHFVGSCDSGDASCYCTASPVNPLMQDCVTYAAISDASQTGPNIFWALAALRYAAVSGNTTWLQQYLPAIRLSMTFLLERYDPNVGLFLVPGPPWIDTFIRANYTSDTNAAMVLLCERMADAETFVGNATGAAVYQSIAATVRKAMVSYLWNTATNDHFCTNSNPGTTAGSVIACARDFVDYDSNLLAVAAGVVTGPTATAVLRRVDSGVCTHARGTYVSEVYYDAANCNSANTGDSAVTMGRIAWADGLARRAVGDPATFDSFFLPLQLELLSSTFMYERYTCQATPTHNAYYIEYPEVVNLLVMDARYGLEVGFQNITVAPLLTVNTFTLSLFQFTVVYDNTAPGTVFMATFPYTGTKTVVVGGLPPGAYTVSVTGAPYNPTTITVAGDGVLAAPAVPMGVGVQVTVAHAA